MPEVEASSAPADETAMLSIVLPAYLEEENLRLLLPRIQASLAQLPVRSEVIVIDTMAPLDGTRQVALAMGARAFPREGGNSYGDAVRTGIMKSQGDWVIFMDADGSHPPEWIEKLFAERHHDLVIASRYVQQGFTENSRTLVAMSRVLNWTYSLVLGIRVQDVSNSFRLYRGSQLRALKLSCNNFDVVEEVLIKLLRAKQNMDVLEIPFTFKRRMFGDSKRNLLLFTMGYVFTLVKLRFFIDAGDQLLRFCVVGMAGSLTNLCLFALGAKALGLGVNISATVAFIAAATQNFLLNRAWTFRRAATVATGNPIAWTKYLLVNLAGLGINLLVLNAVTLMWGVRYSILGQALGIAAGMASNFLMSKRFVFRAGPDHSRAVAVSRERAQ